MKGSVEQLHPALAQQLIDEGKSKELYRLVWLSRVYPDDADAGKCIVVKCTGHLFATDANEAYQLFSNNVPEDYPVWYLMMIGTVQGVEEDSMLEIKRGPRAIN